MSKNVFSLRGEPTGQPKPNEHCIATLEEWLDMARAGELIGVAMAGLRSNGCGRYAVGGTIGGYSMLGALDMATDDVKSVVRGDT